MGHLGVKPLAAFRSEWLVKLAGEVVTAATAQDAINAAVTQNKETFSGNRKPAFDGPHALLVQFPSGLGVVATGMGTYEDTGDAVLSYFRRRVVWATYSCRAACGLSGTITCK